MKTARILVLASVLITLGGLAHAQQASTPSSGTPQKTDPPQKTTTGPSADLLKRAKEEGFKPEVRNSVTMFCWKDADMNSRIPTKKCVNEDQLQIVLDRRQLQKDQLRNYPAPGTKGN